MRAVVLTAFGPPGALQLGEREKPTVSNDGVLVRVHATSVNPSEWYAVTGRPYVARPQMGLRAPKTQLIGADFAGTVEAAGPDVTEFRPGDEVFGVRTGAFAEYLDVRVAVARKPANISFEQAAGVGVAGLTALQGLRNHGDIRSGMNVLINGASGGVGTFAVQIAKAFGARVSGVCSTRNVEIARSLGADRVVDYTREDFTKSDERYDLMLDVAGSRPWRDLCRVLTPDARMIIVGGPKKSRLLGPLSHIARVRVASMRSSQKMKFFVAKTNRADVVALGELIESGKVTPVVDRCYPLEKIGEALDYLGEGHAQGGRRHAVERYDAVVSASDPTTP